MLLNLKHDYFIERQINKNKSKHVILFIYIRATLNNHEYFYAQKYACPMIV